MYIHAEDCPRYAGDAGFSRLREPTNARGVRERAAADHPSMWRMDGDEPVIEHLLAQPEVDYIQVNSTTAGCYTFDRTGE